VTVPVVEEELQVGKRQVQRGGARIHTHITETPVQEQVTLREEHVTVDRHPVNRPASQADLQNALQDRTYEVTETAEEAVVAKQARVVEEVVVGKQATEHTQTVQDTVRRTDVEVENLAGTGSAGNYAQFDTDFRNDFKTRYGTGSGANYDQYLPAYRYGYDLRNNAQYANATDWNTIEPGIRQDFESRGIGAWDWFKDAVRYGWERTKQAGHNATAAVTGHTSYDNPDRYADEDTITGIGSTTGNVINSRH
jgi:uncharacterized protein (TIGR02271 family)